MKKETKETAYKGILSAFPMDFQKSWKKYKWLNWLAVAIVAAIAVYVATKKKTGSSDEALKKANDTLGELLQTAGETSTTNGITNTTNNDTNTNPSGANNFAILDMHELRLSRNGFTVSDLCPNTYSANGRNYHSFYLIMDDDSTLRTSFVNVDLSAYSGHTLMIRKFVVDSAAYPNYTDFVNHAWQINDQGMLHHSQAFIKL